MEHKKPAFAHFAPSIEAARGSASGKLRLYDYHFRTLSKLRLDVAGQAQFVRNSNDAWSSRTCQSLKSVLRIAVERIGVTMQRGRVLSDVHLFPCGVRLVYPPTAKPAPY
jgi:hypothetical protein